MIESTIIDIRVRYVECDAQSVAHHSSYPVWMEIARTELLRVNGVSYRQCEEMGVFFVVVRMELRYRRPARYDDTVSVHVSCTNFGRIKLEHAYQIKRGEELLAEATTTLACVDRTGRPQAMPEGFLGKA
jgi:acyl-CoA thioester hydrolase